MMPIFQSGRQMFKGEHKSGHQGRVKLGCERIVSKRLGSPCRLGRSPHWVKVKNPIAPAVTREAKEDWSV
jgi:hypothetical protein